MKTIVWFCSGNDHEKDEWNKIQEHNCLDLKKGDILHVLIVSDQKVNSSHACTVIDRKILIDDNKPVLHLFVKNHQREEF